jgi:hypothetical protein
MFSFACMPVCFPHAASPTVFMIQQVVGVALFVTNIVFTYVLLDRNILQVCSATFVLRLSAYTNLTLPSQTLCLRTCCLIATFFRYVVRRHVCCFCFLFSCCNVHGATSYDAISCCTRLRAQLSLYITVQCNATLSAYKKLTLK